MTNVCIIATIVIYLVGMLLVGFVYSKSNEDSTDFYLGGRKMGPLVTAMSAEASDMSSWLLMGLPGLAYLTGIASPGWTAIGLAVGTWLNWLIVARRLRRYSANLDAITVPQFLSLRFHDQRNLLNALGAVIIIVFFIPYTASGFAACGKLFHSLFGVDYMIAMIVSALVIVGYTILGGFRAVTTTDLIQSVVMSIALVAVLAYGIGVAGGWGAVMENAHSLSGYLTMAASHNAAAGTAASYSLLDIVSTMAWGLGYFGMPHILLRFMAIEDEKKLVLSRRIASVWVVIAMTASIVIGVVGLGMTKAGALEFLSGSSSETLIVRIASLIAQHGVLAAVLAGLILAGILLAEAAVVQEGINATQDQVYGIAARGGECCSEVIVSDDSDINYAKVNVPDIVLAMSQAAFNKYAPRIKDGGIVFVDTVFVEDMSALDGRDCTIVKVPITEISKNETGKTMLANVTALGVICEYTKLIKNENMIEEILTRVPKGTEEINRKAFNGGVEAVRAMK